MATMRRQHVLLVAFIAILGTSVRGGQAPGDQQPAPTANSATLDGLLNAMTMRNIGAFRTAAWISAIDVPETPVRDHLYTIFAASRSGGLWRTKNAGTTWTNVTDGIDLEATGA